MTTDFANFLLDRIDDDQLLAQRAVPGRWTALPANQARDGFDVVAIQGDQAQFDVAYDHSAEPREGACSEPTAAFLVSMHPARVMAECETKRKLLHEHREMQERGNPVCARCDDDGFGVAWPCLTTRLIALVYADHPDYREEWRP